MIPHPPGWRPSLYVVLLLSGLQAPPAAAVEPSAPLNVQELQRPDFLPAQPPGHFELPPVAPATASPPNFTPGGPLLRQIRFNGNQRIPTAALENVAAPWLGRPMGVADLESLRLELTRFCIGRGYINSGARLATPPMSADGVADIEIVEGQLTDITVGGLEGLDPDYVKTRLHPDPQAALNIEVLRENFQLLLDDPLFARINAQLSPGHHPGEAVLNLETQRASPHQFTVHINNHRPPSIGEAVLAVTGVMRNLTGRGDTLETLVQKPFAGDRSFRVGLAWRLPLNYVGTQLSVHADDGTAVVVEEPLRDIHIQSRLQSWEIGLSQRLAERLRHRLTIGLSHLSRTNRTRLDGQPFSFVAGEPDGVTQASTIKFWQEYTHRSEQQVFALRSTFAHTRNNLEQISTLLPHTQASANYSTWLGQFHYVHKLADEGMQLLARLAIQESRHKVLSMDGLSIGGIATVRGFRENQMIRDTGYVANLELDIPLWQPATGSGHTLNLVPFLDYGRGRNIGEVAQSIASGGVALRWRWADFSLDLALARQLSKPGDIPPGKGALQDQGIHLQVSYKL